MKHLIKKTSRCDPHRWNSLCGMYFEWKRATNAAGPEEADCPACLRAYIREMDSRAAHVEESRGRAERRLEEVRHAS